MTNRLANMGQDKYCGLTANNHRGERHFNGVVRCIEEAMGIPLKRRKPTTYFVNSMSDLFHRDVPFGFVDKVFAVMALCPRHTFQILTKRPERMAEYMAGRAAVSPPNVWLGTSVENQAAADERIPHLLETAAAVRFLSCEPLLGPLTTLGLRGLNWVIVGGESGPNARPCNIDWIRAIVQQCREAGVPCFVKQLGSHPIGRHSSGFDFRLKLKDRKGGDPAEWPEDLRLREMPRGYSGLPRGAGEATHATLLGGA